MSDLVDQLLRSPGGAQVQTEVPIMRETFLLRCQFSVERHPDGRLLLHFDMLLSPQAAERYTIPFDENGFEGFKDALIAAGANLRIVKALPAETRH